MTGIGALDNTKVAMERENVLMKKRSAGMYKLWLVEWYEKVKLKEPSS